MPLSQGFPGHSALATFADVRRDLEGSVVRDAAGKMRAGVFPAHFNALVTGRSDMKVAIADFRAVIDRGGAIFMANVGADTSVTLDAAPAANRRIDLIYAIQQSTTLGDAASLPIFGFVKGTASATPVAPSLPANLSTALPLATVEIPAGATTTLSAGVVITQVFPYTAMAGGTVALRNSVELAAWAPADGSRAYCLADTRHYVRAAGAWNSGRGRAGFAVVGSTWDHGGGMFGGGVQTTLSSEGAAVSSQRITPLIAGRWRIVLNGTWADNSTGLRQASIRKNDGSAITPSAPGNYAGVLVPSMGKSDYSLSLDADFNGTTDFVTFSLYQNSGIRLTNAWTAMTAEYLG